MLLCPKGEIVSKSESHLDLDRALLFGEVWGKAWSSGI